MFLASTLVTFSEIRLGSYLQDGSSLLLIVLEEIVPAFGGSEVLELLPLMFSTCKEAHDLMRRAGKIILILILILMLKTQDLMARILTHFQIFIIDYRAV